MGSLGKEWRKCNLDKSIQRYKFEPVPKGFKVLYAIVNRFGKEKAYIGKAGHTEKGAKYRIFEPGGHIRGPNAGRSAIHDAITAHGWDSFKWFILAGPIPSERINEAEVNAIAKYNTLTESQGGNGYNIMKGGDGGEKTPEMVAKQKATMATPESRAKRSAISKKMWTKEYRSAMQGRNLGSATSIMKRTASIAASKQRENVLANHREGGKRMWTGEKGEKRRDAAAVRSQQRREKLRQEALPLPPLTEDRVNKQIYIVQVAKKAQKPGDLVRWRLVKTKSGQGMTGSFEHL